MSEKRNDNECLGADEEEDTNLLLNLLYDLDNNLMGSTPDSSIPSLVSLSGEDPPLDPADSVIPTPTFELASNDRKRKASETEGEQAAKKAKYEELLALQDDERPTTSRQAAELAAKIKAFKEMNSIPEATPEEVKPTASRAALEIAEVLAFEEIKPILEDPPAQEVKPTASRAALEIAEVLAFKDMNRTHQETSKEAKLTASKAAMEISVTLAKSLPEKPIILSIEQIMPPNPDGNLVDFQQEIDKEQVKPRPPGQSSSNLTPDSGWQRSFVARLEEFEGIMDLNMTEVTDPEARTMPAENLQRPWAPPSPRPDLSVANKLSKMFCTFKLNAHLSLEAVVHSLDNATFNRDIGVVQKRYIATQLAWIWADGTIMIINGSSHAMLAETQAALMAKIAGQANFKADASNNLQTSRSTGYVQFPWQIDIQEFSVKHSLSSHLLLKEMHYVYYVDKDLPGVVARVYGSGWIQVFAMSSEKTDQMLTRLYLLTSDYEKD